MKFLERQENKIIDNQKLRNLIEITFSPLTESEILRLAKVESKRTGYSIGKMRKFLTDRNAYNPKMMRKVYEKRIGNMVS